MFRNNFYSTSRRHQQSPARRHPTEPAQIAVQEEFAESISSQEVQPGFLLQPSQENLLGAVPTEPSALESISQLNSDPQAHLIIRMSKKQQQKPRTVQIPPVQLTSPSRKEPFPSNCCRKASIQKKD